MTWLERARSTVPVPVAPLAPIATKRRANGTNGAIGTATRDIFATVSQTSVEEAERAALAADSVPAVYLAAWARLQSQKPFPASPATWQQVIVDAGLFLDQWGALAATWGWSPGDLFDVPAEQQRGGLVWFIAGSAVESFGPEHARTADNRVFDRKKGTQP